MAQTTIEVGAEQTMTHGAPHRKVINIQPITRIEGHARIAITLRWTAASTPRCRPPAGNSGS